MADFANSYAAIIKQEKQEDGSLLVYGKATDDSLDIDQQICDDVWLSSAMPEWFKSGGNIREQHSSIAAGVAKEYESKPDGHYISVLVVDPVSVKKVESGVLKGFSIGIKSPRVVRDQKAANGRIIDGQIVEVSLVDRPANPNAKLMLAKSVEGEANLVKVEEFIEKGNPDQERDERGRFSSGGGGGESSSLPTRASGETPQEARSNAAARQDGALENSRSAGGSLNNASKDLKDANSKMNAEEKADPRAVNQAQEHVLIAGGHIAMAQNASDKGNGPQMDAHISAASQSLREAASVLQGSTSDALRSVSQQFSSISNSLSSTRSKSATITEKKDKSMLADVIKEMLADSKKFDQASYDVARRGIAQLIISEASEIAETDSDEREDIDTLLSALKHLFNFRDGELDEDADVASNLSGSITGALLNLAADATSKDCDCDGCAACKADGGCDEDICKGCTKSAAKSADISKCLECGCHQVGDAHGKTQIVVAGGTPAHEVANVSTATIVTPEQNAGSIKSAEGEEATPAEEVKADEVTDEVTTTEILDEKSVTAIIEKAVKSATDSVKAEIAELQIATKAAEEKAVALESELVIAKSAAASGGPKRTGRTAVTDNNELLIKAAEYRLKASATSDPILAKGYKALEKEYLEKSGKVLSEDN